MEELLKAAKALTTYIAEDYVCDVIDDDGDGYTCHSQSQTLQDLVEDVENAIKDATPTVNAMTALKENLIVLVQTGIARQLK